MKVLKPTPRLSASEWADANRYLTSSSSAEPGKWQTSRAEFQREMMDAGTDPSVREVVCMSASQLGKTESLLSVIAYHIDIDPCPMLILQPTLEMAQSFSKDRIANGLLSSTPVLADKVMSPRSRDSGNTVLHKTFSGGHLTVTGANSPAGLSSRPIRVVLADEVDRYPPSAGTEGDPLQLAKRRTATFWNRKVMQVSTPTIKGASKIEDAYEGSDRRQYWVPCDHCGEHQLLTWGQVQWPEGQPEKAAYVCEHCGAAWTEANRLSAISNGEWRAREPFRGIAGFWINGLYSPWITLPEAAREFLTVKGQPGQLRTWINTYLAESWDEAQGEAVDDFVLMERAEPIERVPESVGALTAGIDVQDDRVEVTVVGWAANGSDEAWVVDHAVIYGDPSTTQLWSDLDQVLFGEFETESGGDPMKLSAAAIDTGGHHTNATYLYAARKARVFAVKGVGGEGRTMISRPTRNNHQKVPLFGIGVHALKEQVYSRLKIEEPGPGYLHFSDRLEPEWYAQLTAERIVTKYHKGFPRREFVKSRARNEALDCMAYAIAAYHIGGVHARMRGDIMRRPAAGTAGASGSKRSTTRLLGARINNAGFVHSWR